MNGKGVSAILGRLQSRCLVAGGAALLVSAPGLLLVDGRQFLQSYLLGFLLWSGVALGCFALLLLHNMTGGNWGFPIRRALEAAAQTFPVLALLFLPLALGMGSLYIWTDSERVAADEVLRHKVAYLNSGFFLARSALYFALWIGIAHLVRRWSLRQDETGEAGLTGRIQRISGPGLGLYGLTATFAAVDWVMSLEPHWFSTIYGLLFIAGQALSALAFMVLVMRRLSAFEPLRGVVAEKHYHDLGNLSLAFVMLWAYMAFSQYLIIWSGNLPEEIPWYVHRTQTSWQWMALFLILFHFALPFLLLLSRRAKRSGSALSRIAVAILVMRLVDLHWWVVPSLHAEGFHVHWLDLTLPLGLGGIWLAAFLQQLRRVPLLPRHDPRFEKIAEGVRA